MGHLPTWHRFLSLPLLCPFVFLQFTIGWIHRPLPRLRVYIRTPLSGSTFLEVFHVSSPLQKWTEAFHCWQSPTSTCSCPSLLRMPSDLWAFYGLCSFFFPKMPHSWNYIVCQLPILALLIKVHFRTPYWVLPFLIEWTMVIPAMKFISHNFRKGAWEEHFLSPRIPVHVNVLSSHLTDNIHWHSILKWWRVPPVLWMRYPRFFQQLVSIVKSLTLITL